MKIYISPLSAIEEAIARHQPSHLISALGEEEMIETPAGIAPQRHLKLTMHDISEVRDGMISPSTEHIGRLISFIDEWDTTAAPLLVHCWAGISRSSAAAFIALCRINPDMPEEALARLLREQAAFIYPNALMVRHADALMGREGRMSRAIDAIGPGALAWEGNLFDVPAHPEALISSGEL
ncbi:MAG: hypothetical protein V6Z81_10975 [Parvularculales bacterium]